MIGDLTIFVLVAATFAIGVVGSLAGLVLGNLRLPLLFAVLPPAVAGGTNVTISGAGAGAGTLTHIRGRRFDREAFLAMAPLSIVGAVVGGLLAGFVPGTILILLISLIVLEQGYELLRSSRKGTPPDADPDRPPRDLRWRISLGVAGLLIGVLGGLVGLILGTIRLPALLRAGVGVKDAIATNLAVGFLVGIAGLVGHYVGGTIDLRLVLILVPPAVVGGILGARLTGSFSDSGLRRLIGCILIGVGAILLVFLGLRVPTG